MKLYYMLINRGSGLFCEAYKSKKERDDAVKYDRSGCKYSTLTAKTVKRNEARRYKEFVLRGETDRFGCEQWYKFSDCLNLIVKK